MRKIKSLYWKLLLHFYAGMAMQGLMTNPLRNINLGTGRVFKDEVAGVAYGIAEALVNKVKEETNENLH